MSRRGGDKIFQKKKQELEKKDFKRNTNDKCTVPDVIISCEDSVSAPTYFKMLIHNLIDNKLITQDSFVIVPHTGATNPTGVLKNLKSYEDDQGKTYKDFEHKWIVIDRDVERVNGGGHTAKDFNEAIKNAKSTKAKYNIDVAYANDSFELWYLLHFCYRDSAILRDELNTIIIKNLKDKNPHIFSRLNKDNIKKENYTKLIFKELLDLQDTAIKNSKRLLSSYLESHNPETDNPSTTIHILVELLNSLTKPRTEQ
jgi:hypothetical protein